MSRRFSAKQLQGPHNETFDYLCDTEATLRHKNGGITKKASVSAWAEANLSHFVFPNPQAQKKEYWTELQDHFPRFTVVCINHLNMELREAATRREREQQQRLDDEAREQLGVIGWVAVAFGTLLLAIAGSKRKPEC